MATVVSAAAPIHDVEYCNGMLQKNSFEVLARIQQDAIRQGTLSAYLRQYVLNPSLSTDDIRLTLTFLVGLCALRFVLAGAFHIKARKFPSLFRVLLKSVSKKKREHKFAENLWYVCWHTFSFVFGITVLMQEALTPEEPGWIRLLFRDWDTRWYWFPSQAEMEAGNEGWPMFPVSSQMRRFYLLESAFWVSCLVFLWLETIRDDFYVLFVHHVATIILLVFSYLCSFWRIGAVVVMAHDIADILLYSAKTLHYSRMPSCIVDSFFGAFVIGFFFSRLVCFPLLCLLPAIDSSSWGVWSGVRHKDIPGGIFLPGFLCVLQILHIFWFGLIVKMVIRTWREHTVTKGGDIRSDDESASLEDEEDEEEEEEEEGEPMPVRPPRPPATRERKVSQKGGNGRHGSSSASTIAGTSFHGSDDE